MRMAKVNYKISYTPNFWSLLSPTRASAKISTALDKANPVVVHNIQAKANFTQGYQTGALKGSVNGKKVGNTKLEFTAPATNSKGKQYGQYVENGTGKGPAQPFMHPAVKESLPQVRNLIEQELKHG